MSGSAIQAVISHGFGQGAAVLGSQFDVFRATSAGNPIDPANLLAVMPAAFPFDTKFSKPPPPGKNAERLGLFDQTDIQPGDYFVGGGETYFVGSLLPFAWPQAFYCPHTVTIYSAPTEPLTGDGGYSGTDATDRVAIMTGWPAAIIEGGRGDKSSTQNLPGDVYLGGWLMYLPQAPGVVLQSTHIVVDELGRTYIISSAEMTDYWRIVMMQQRD